MPAGLLEVPDTLYLRSGLGRGLHVKSPSYGSWLVQATRTLGLLGGSAEGACRPLVFTCLSRASWVCCWAQLLSSFLGRAFGSLHSQHVNTVPLHWFEPEGLEMGHSVLHRHGNLGGVPCLDRDEWSFFSEWEGIVVLTELWQTEEDFAWIGSADAVAKVWNPAPPPPLNPFELCIEGCHPPMSCTGPLPGGLESELLGGGTDLLFPVVVAFPSVTQAPKEAQLSRGAGGACTPQ